MADGTGLAPRQIEKTSFDIISKRINLSVFRGDMRPIVLRVVHATGDFRIAGLLRVHPGALQAAKKALRSGAEIVTDVNMVKAGISSNRLRAHGNRVSCAIHHRDVARRASALGITRACAAMRKHKERMRNGIVVIGNAPTALFEVLRLLEDGVRPAVIVGVPVGFVGAAESKQALEKSPVPYITVRGTRGGSNVAAAIVNAMLDMAADA